jgi:hypothetical protein
VKKALAWAAFVVFGALALFFVFYEVRLLYVTHILTQIRRGGQGTYVGAVVFPILALAFGLIANVLAARTESVSLFSAQLGAACPAFVLDFSA